MSDVHPATPLGSPPAGEASFEDMLADPHGQFDLRSEVLASITAYATAPPASAGSQPWEPARAARATWNDHWAGPDPYPAGQTQEQTFAAVWGKVAQAAITAALVDDGVARLRDERDAIAADRDRLRAENADLGAGLAVQIAQAENHWLERQAAEAQRDQARAESADLAAGYARACGERDQAREQLAGLNGILADCREWMEHGQDARAHHLIADTLAGVPRDVTDAVWAARAALEQP